MKKLISLLLVGIMVLTLNISVLSASANADITVILDDVELQFDVAPRLIGGRTMVPLRAIFEALGTTVEWDDSTKTVIAYNEAVIVKCTIGSNVMYVNETEKNIDVAPMVVDSRTLVPARFIAESFNCDVTWDGDTKTVSIVSSPIDYTQLEKENESNVVETPDIIKTEETPSVTVSGDPGTRENPYSALDGKTVILQKYSFDSVKQVAVTCTNVIRGEQGNSLAYSENRFNDSADANSEWIFMEFNVNYISSSDGSDDVLEGSDIIYKDTFFTTNGTALTVKDMATLSHTYKGYGVFDVTMYPGATAKIVIGLLIEKNVGDILLRIPYKTGNSNSWINCTQGTGSTSGTASNTSSSTNSGNPVSSSGISYYSGTTVPTYTSIVGEPLKEYNSATHIYMYDDKGNDYVNYITALVSQYGWTHYSNKTKDGRLTYYLTKNGIMIGVTYAAKYDEVWIILP